MTVSPTDEEILATWHGAEAPLLPVLHAFVARDGWLTEPALNAIATGLDIPLVELFGTVTFYHHLPRAESDLGPRICDGTVCRLHGSQQLLAEHPGARAMPCPGRCDEPIPILVEGRVLRALPGQKAEPATSPLPPVNPDGLPEVVFAGVREPGRSRISGYRRGGGYQALERAVLHMSPDAVRAEITQSGLAGRGGAGFPTGRKWDTVAGAPGATKYVVANADEGEPGCFKDRALMDHDPHAVLEGMALAAYATGAATGIIYLRFEYPDTHVTLERAIAEAREAGLLGREILGSRFSFDVEVRRGAGAYICGEETALLESLEGKRPFPRERPPFPATHGLHQLPTVVQNVETLCAVAPILRHGPDWYRSLGRNGQAGTKIISVSGDVQQPGNYEVPLGFPLRRLLEVWAGGARPGRKLTAFTMAGLSGGILGGDAFDVTLDEPSVRAAGSMLGAAGIMVFDDSRDLLHVAETMAEFFADESCGKCFPCRIGTQRLRERLNGEYLGAETDQELDELSSAMRQLSACGLGQAAPLVVEGLRRYFPALWDQHVRSSSPGR